MSGMVQLSLRFFPSFTSVAAIPVRYGYCLTMSAWRVLADRRRISYRDLFVIFCNSVFLKPFTLRNYCIGVGLVFADVFALPFRAPKSALVMDMPQNCT